MATKRTHDKRAPSGASATNIFGIADVSRWDIEVGQWKQGKSVDKAAILRLLESGDQIPPEAHALIAGLIDGSVKARKGMKPNKHSRLVRSMLADHVANFETMLKDPSTIPGETDKETRDWLNSLRLQSTGTPNSKARKLIADGSGISMGQLGKYITERNRQLKAIADKHGVTLADVKRKLRIGEP